MEDTRRQSRRPHSEELKALVLAECMQPGALVAKVALLHGLNANLVHKWRRAAQSGQVATARPAATARLQGGAGGFVALSLPSQATAGAATAAADIRIELRRNATTIAIAWPTSAAADCAAWMRELLR